MPPRQDRVTAGGELEGGCHPTGDPGDDEQRAPDAIDDGGQTGEDIEQRVGEPAHPAVGILGEVDGKEQGEWQGEGDGKERHGTRAGKERQEAKLSLLRLPRRRGQQRPQRVGMQDRCRLEVQAHA